MTKKLVLSALLTGLIAFIALYAMQAVGADVPSRNATAEVVIEHPFFSPDLSFPPPQEPLDRTPITPVETVGAASYEPF